jgi:hypothetical protein
MLFRTNREAHEHQLRTWNSDIVTFLTAEVVLEIALGMKLRHQLEIRKRQ